jgi:hypothetical protein
MSVIELIFNTIIPEETIKQEIKREIAETFFIFL